MILHSIAGGLGGAVSTLPSPTQGVWYAGPIPIRAYALFILFGILIAVQLGERRWGQRGGRPGAVLDIAAWAVPFGIVGGRLYHVITSWQPYFGPDGDPVKALYIWEGGLGIWGAVTLGAVGAWIGARRAGILLPPMMDALAPGIILAQAVGRWGNWFNNELYGRETDLPWALEIYRWNPELGRAVLGPNGQPILEGTYHPAFLYESLWNVGVALVLLWADRRWRMGHGRVFALYVLLYTVGRGWIEALRVDEANHVFGLRIDLWVSLLVGLGALTYLVLSTRLRPGRETVLVRADAADTADADDPAAPESDADDEAVDADVAAADADGEADPDGEADDAVKAEESSPTDERAKTGAPDEAGPAAATDGDPAPGADAAPTAKTKPKAKPTPEAKPEPEAKPVPEAKPEPEAKPASEAEPPADTKAAPEPKSSPAAKAKSAVDAALAARSKPERKVAPGADATPATEPATDAEPSTEPEAKPVEDAPPSNGTAPKAAADTSSDPDRVEVNPA